ncbi:hypothetical protein MIZ03_1946 [Rhodoferax lithotrophicus]|uniref:Uncharacterized protein n=1 Tax=Rhodoferax lithotrophicus TaxID=2798804 RepID=A0ABM7ML66_9BURK|nr:hypothetical protein MIZ03_1946 [Rhodoferax sp. MIZ03]
MYPYGYLMATSAKKAPAWMPDSPVLPPTSTLLTRAIKV